MRRVVVVVGKGGVGKSVVAGGLGVLAASRGRRTCIAEVNGSETMSALFDTDPVGYEGAPLAEGLRGVSITAQRSVEEYLVRTLRFRLLYELVFRNRYIEPFMNGVLGLSDLMTIGKVLDLEWERSSGAHGPDGSGPYRYDLVVVDAPATGHGISLLRAPQAMMDVTRAGPLHSNARLIRDLLADRSRTAVLAVTLAEELPVSETIELVARLRRHVDTEIRAVVVNGVPPPVFPDAEASSRWPELRESSIQAGGHAAAAARDAERALRDRARAEKQMRRLRDALDLPLVEVPLLPERDLSAHSLATVGRALEKLA
jgi:anion-transporting  ArsA/GET3 family ATPase